MKLMKNSESGQALVLALILLALGTLLVVPGLNLTSTSTRYHQLIGNKTQEGYSADSGMEYALCKLYNAPGAYTEIPLDETFDLNGRTVHIVSEYSGSGLYQLTSTATSADGRRTTIKANVNLSAGVFLYAVAAKQSLTFTGGGTVNSAPVPGNGDICSNGNIDIAANWYINGDAYAVGTISGNVVPPSQKYPGQDPITFPGDYTDLYRVMALEGGTYNGSMLITTNQELGPKYINGNLDVKQGAIVTLTGTLYVTGKLTVEGQGQFKGDHNVCVEGDISLTGGGSYIDSTMTPIFYAKPGSIKLNQSTVYAVVYAPISNVELNSVILYGAVGGQTVLCKGGSFIIWNAALNGRADLPGGELKTISYSYN